MTTSTDAESADAAAKAAAEAEIRRLERETEGLKILKEQQDAENKRRMDELDTVSTGVPDRDESEPLEASEEVDARLRELLDDPAFTAQFRDLGELLQAGRISREQFTEAVMGRLTFMGREDLPPPERRGFVRNDAAGGDRAGGATVSKRRCPGGYSFRRHRRDGRRDGPVAGGDCGADRGRAERRRF